MSDAERLCPRCRTTKPVAAFYRARGEPGGRAKVCSACAAEARQRQRERRQADAARDRALAAARRAEDAARPRKKIAPQDMRDWGLQQGGRRLKR